MEKEAVAARVKLSREAILKLLLFAAIAWLVFGFISFFLPPLLRWLAPTLAANIEPGTFGDMFGAGNAFFSALAFAAVAYTLWLQTQELEEARLERREARRDSKENIKLQGEIADSQRAATEMQLKVAQSGDVYRAFERVAGSEFQSAMQRLRFLETALRLAHPHISIWKIEGFVTADGIDQVAADIQNVAISPFPNEYREGFQSATQEYLTNIDVTAQIIEDIESCISAVLNLRPAIAMGLLNLSQLPGEISADDCRLLAGIARGARSFYTKEPVLLDELAQHIEAVSAAES